MKPPHEKFLRTPLYVTRGRQAHVQRNTTVAHRQNPQTIEPQTTEPQFTKVFVPTLQIFSI